MIWRSYNQIKFYWKIRNKMKHHVPSRCTSYVQYKLLFLLNLWWTHHSQRMSSYFIYRYSIYWLEIDEVNIFNASEYHNQPSWYILSVLYIASYFHNAVVFNRINTSYWKMKHVTVTCYFTSIPAIV